MGNNISGRTDAWVNLFSLEILLSLPFPRKCKYAEAFLGNMGAVGHRPRFFLVPECCGNNTCVAGHLTKGCNETRIGTGYTYFYLRTTNLTLDPTLLLLFTPN